jgi:signal transduction histidine kinase
VPEAQRPTVLNVDDSEERLRYRTAVLRAEGFEVLEARNGTQALAIALRTRPSLVLLDVNLPDLDGFDVCARLRAERITSAIPVLHVSAAMREDEHWIRALRSGSAGYLREPVSDELLTEVIRTVLKQTAERQSVEAELRQAQKLEAVGLLAAGIAHDFNNALTVIIACTDMLMNQIGAELPIGRDLSEIYRAAAHAADLTKQLLAFAKQQPLRLDLLDANTVVADAARLIGRVIGETVRVGVQSDTRECVIYADRAQLLQILLNLATNARDAMPDGGTLTIQTTRVTVDAPFAALNPPLEPGGYVKIAVEDTGHGMTDEIKHRAFDPFFTTKDVGQGTGLGLSTVYGITRQLGGFIVVDTALGKGARFDLYFPEAIGTMPGAAERRPFDVATERSTILVVEDDEAVRGLAAGVLKRHGYRVLQASGPGEALSFDRDTIGEIDLLLTDIVMPGLSGRALAERLTAEHPRLRVVYMSGYFGAEGPLEPDDLFLQKPFSAGDLLARVSRALQIVQKA